MDTDFQIVGIRNTEDQIVSRHKKWYQGKPLISALLLAVILSGCLCCHLIMTKDPGYMDLAHYNEAPGGEFLFGTDTMGRDIFSMIWYGGRISLLIGVLATFLSTVLAIVFGSVSGCAPEWVDSLLMRFTEIFLCRNAHTVRVPCRSGYAFGVPVRCPRKILKQAEQTMRNKRLS